MEWVRKFTLALRNVAQAAKIPLEMLYVGKSNPRVKVRKNNATTVAEQLSHILPDMTLIWFFWVRLESMWYSKVQHGKSVENDTIMQEIMTMLSFDGSDQGWVVINKGSAEMARAGQGGHHVNGFERVRKAERKCWGARVCAGTESAPHRPSHPSSLQPTNSVGDH